MTKIHRVFPLDTLGRIVQPPTVLDAADDVSAIEAAQKLVEHQDIEVWHGPRRVSVLRSDNAAVPPPKVTPELLRERAKKLEALASRNSDPQWQKACIRLGCIDEKPTR